MFMIMVILWTKLVLTDHWSKTSSKPQGAVYRTCTRSPFSIKICKLKYNKKHSKNVDTSKSMTFDLDLWLWSYVKFIKTSVIRCRLLHCTLVPSLMSESVIPCVIIISFFNHWRNVKVIHQGQRLDVEVSLNAFLIFLL